MPEVLLGDRRSTRPTGEPESLARLAGRFLTGAAAIIVVGVGVDLFTLWVLQRQSSAGWELAALGATTNSYPILLVSAAMFYMALALGRSGSIRLYRLAAVYVVLLGLLGLGVFLLLVMNYFALKGAASPAAMTMFKSVVAKSGGLSVVFGSVMLVLGVLGFRAPRARSA